MLLGLVLALGSAGAQDGSCNATGIWPMPHQCEIAGAGTLEIKTDSLLVVATNLSDTNATFAAHELCRRLSAPPLLLPPPTVVDTSTLGANSTTFIAVGTPSTDARLLALAAAFGVAEASPSTPSLSAPEGRVTAYSLLVRARVRLG